MTDNSKNTILILGAGLMQKKAICSAKNLGYHVCVADGNPKAQCISLADSFVHIDLKDIDSLVKFAKDISSNGSLKGVFTAGTDFSYAVATIAKACNLPGHSPEAAFNASNKAVMRQCFKKEGVSSPHFIRIDDASTKSLYLTAERLGELLYPLVVKPVDNMGGRGCRLVNSLEELKDAVEDAKKNSRSNCAIVEDYMKGPEFSIDALIYNGTLTVCGFADRHIFFPPYFIEMGHTMPSIFSEETINSLIAEFARGVKALELTHGAAKGDIKLGPKGPMIGEIAARLSGGYMSGWTYPYASDFNVTEQAILLAIGEKPEKLLQLREKLTSIKQDTGFELYTIPCNKTSAERAWISIPGIIKEVCGRENAENGVKDFFPRAANGDTVVFPHNNVEKCGNVITVADTNSEAVKKAEKSVSKITLRLETPNEQTELFLAQNCRNTFPPSAFAPNDDVMDKLAEFLNGDDKNCNAFNEKGEVIVPECLKACLTTIKDWNYKTMEDVINEFSKNYPNPPAIRAEQFWHDFIRGSLQGILYTADKLKVKQ